MAFLLDVARCPRTGQTLHEIDGCLVTADRRFSYRIANGIPVLLPEEALEVKP